MPLYLKWNSYGFGGLDRKKDTVRVRKRASEREWAFIFILKHLAPQKETESDVLIASHHAIAGCPML